ncbi:MAG: hypothetical protein RLZZ34_2198, partial [Verrucomicrobiota bacterium]
SARSAWSDALGTAQRHIEAARRWFDQASRIGGKAMVRQMAADDPDLAPLREYIERL